MPAAILGKKPQKRYHHGDLRPALLRASRAVVESQGVGALTFRAVARRVGVSHAAPAHHFADKSELLATVAAQGFDELTAAMSAALQGAGCETDAINRLNATGVAYVAFAAQHPKLFRLMFGREMAACTAACLVESSGRAYAVLESAAREVLYTQGEAEPAELEVLIASAWSLVHGMSMLWLDGRLMPDDGSPEALATLARRVTEMLGAAVRPAAC